MDLNLQYRLGKAAFERRNYRGAARYFSAVLDEVGHDTNVLEYRARSYYHSAALTKAEADCRTILERTPTEEYALLLLVRSLERQQRHDEALEYRRVLAAYSGRAGDIAGHEVFG
ncbi:Tetratricopeptide repeat-containing protein [Raineyella antarctica]|uniref:Tetratricopeptide repeat-containing protein n=1 Tax=Raineyella antarctica TaxID=1577474 RepID=A0A1G6H7X2_9ACTN|nr:tetratricopeptide repeat protein [Raineyella antarctica]SDB90188.1 Tetratricopeptide repeat-containing protein [Raineyella antarctica]